VEKGTVVIILCNSRNRSQGKVCIPETNIPFPQCTLLAAVVSRGCYTGFQYSIKLRNSEILNLKMEQYKILRVDGRCSRNNNKHT